MKTNYKIILTGVVIFALGISLVQYELAVDPSFDITVDVGLLFILGLITPGLIITGIGMMLEFVKQEYGKK